MAQPGWLGRGVLPAARSNGVHIDTIGLDLFGQCLGEVAISRSAKPLLGFVIRGWQALGVADRLSMDNAAEFSGSLRHPRTFS